MSHYRNLLNRLYHIHTFYNTIPTKNNDVDFINR